ncbi:MAG TPA: Type 1 glutamine amidotransferase-like domain-containing protein [Patescibacteria group bacterium]|nr:Type 1 glutamine amidotransferase-like domain-containing protein [Patescibacteria group bacterium]
MKLLLTSAGLSNKTIVEVFNNLVGLPNEKIKIVYIPTASNVEEGDKGWLIDDYTNLKNQKYGCIDIVDIAAVPRDIWLPRIKEANVIFIGGGNTYYLMSWLIKSGLDKILPDLLKTRVYAGISAGSMVATINLRLSTSQKSYSEKVYRLENENGLGLVDFHIRPHLNSDFFPKVRIKFIKEIAKDIPEPIYVIDDNTAVVVNSDKVSVVSEGKWKRFN